MLTINVQAKKKKQYFNQTEFEVDFTITHPIQSGSFIKKNSFEILILGEKNRVDSTVDKESATEQIAALYALDENNKYSKVREVVLPRAIIAFDLISSSKDIDKLLLLDSENLSLINFDKQSVEFLTKIASMYLDPNPQFVASKKMVRDINGDDLEDIVISDFKSIKVLIQQSDGEFIKRSLPIKPIIDMGSQHVSFSETRIFSVDTNFDDRPDIVVLENNQLTVFQQLKSGEFSPLHNIIELPMKVSSLEWWNVKGADGQSADQSNLEHQMLETIEDINGDNIVDIMIRRTKSSGVFDRDNRYEIHYGQNQKGTLSYSSAANTSVSAEGTLSGLRLIDVNNDGRKEILVSAFDIGVGQIIGALLSGSIDQDVYVFALNDKDQFIKKPIFRDDVDLNFSLSSGRSGQAVILSADFTGDGNNEMLLSDSSKRLSIYKGNSTIKLFSSAKERHRLSIPKEGSMLVSAKLSKDQKHSLIVRYGKQDDSKLRNKVVILSAK